MRRVVETEILDGLDPNDPDAVRSRRDLRFINKLMGGPSWIVQQVSELQGIRRIVELGAGDGALCNQLKSLMPDCEVGAVDLIPKPDTARDDVRWEKTNVLDYEGFDQHTVVVANLFVHHLLDDELRVLGERLKDVSAIVFAEPHRKTSALWLSRCLFPVVNQVTRHDMISSIKAGFVRDEVPALFGPSFQWDEEIGLLGGIRMKGIKI